MDFTKLLGIATLAGFGGDALLQVITSNTKFDWGLKEYFRQHGRAEAMFTAAGMMAIFYLIYIYLHKTFNFPLNLVSLAVYGVMLDLIFRVCNIFPSLKGYYSQLNYFWSAVWGAIPMMIPLLIAQSLN